MYHIKLFYLFNCCLVFHNYYKLDEHYVMTMNEVCVCVCVLICDSNGLQC